MEMPQVAGIWGNLPARGMLTPIALVTIGALAAVSLPASASAARIIGDIAN